MWPMIIVSHGSIHHRGLGAQRGFLTVMVACSDVVREWTTEHYKQLSGQDTMAGLLWKHFLVLRRP